MKLVSQLFDDDSASPPLSLVAEQSGQITGHILFSRVSVQDSEQPIAASILAPLAVAPSCQKQGIGTRLIAEGLLVLREQGVGLVLVYGDPVYYARSGFEPVSTERFTPPCELTYPHGWMALALAPQKLDAVSGRIQCADALSAAEDW